MGKGKAKQKQKGTIDRQNFSDASIQLFHPAHDGEYASSFLILSVGDERLAFNCGEGFQRLCAECKVWSCALAKPLHRNHVYTDMKQQLISVLHLSRSNGLHHLDSQAC